MAFDCAECGGEKERWDEKYCTHCKREVLAAMKASGYLQVLPPKRARKDENKPGYRSCGSPGTWDNVVKAIEDHQYDDLTTGRTW